MHVNVISPLLCEYENEVNKAQLIKVCAIFFYNARALVIVLAHRPTTTKEQENGTGSVTC